MHNNRSLSRELSLISLGLINDKGDLKLNTSQVEQIFESALDALINHCRDELDNCESELENASQKLLESELQEGVDSSFSNVREELKRSLKKRTQMDKTRKNSPLIKVKDAILIRTDKLSKRGVLNKMSKYIENLN